MLAGVLAATLAQMIARGGADALQAEKDLRGAVKYASNGLKKCNWWDADNECYCDKKSGYSGDRTTGLFRCKKHGGDLEQLKISLGTIGACNKCTDPFGKGCTDRAGGSNAACPVCAVMKKLIKDVEKAARST